MTNTAVSRRSDVVSRVEGDETLVLDLQSQVAHCLSGDVARVWSAAETSIAAISSATGLSEDAVEAALASLRDLELVAAAGLRRRSLFRGAAVGGAMVGAAVVSIPLPAAATANSTDITLGSSSCTNHKAKFVFTPQHAQFTASSYTVTLDYTNASGASRTVQFTMSINGANQKPSGATSVTGGTVTTSNSGTGGSFTITTAEDALAGSTVLLKVTATAATDQFIGTYAVPAVC